MKPISSLIPAYYRLAEDIRAKIESGDLKPGDMLPSETQLARQYEVSRMTVRQGISLLVKEGFVKSIQGKGSFVTNPPMDTLVLKLHENNILGKNEHGKVHLLSVDVICADKIISDKLKVVHGTKILKIIRVISDDEPIAIDTRFLPYIKGTPILEKEIQYAAFPDLVAHHTELFSVRNSLEISAGTLSDKEAKLLNTITGLPCLYVEQIIYSANEQPIGWSKMVCRSDRFKLRAVSQSF